MIVKFDPIMQEHIRRIKDDEIHNHYLGHNTQNELINLIAGEIKTKTIKKLRMRNIMQSFLIVLHI